MLCGNYTLSELVITTIFTVTTLYVVQGLGKCALVRSHIMILMHNFALLGM